MGLGLGGMQASTWKSFKRGPRRPWIKPFLEVCKDVNFSRGAFCKSHLPTEITGGCVAALRRESWSKIGLLNEWVKAGTPWLSD